METHFDAIIIGSGFGGCLAALPLVEAGQRVLMLERGDWVERSAENWGDEGPFVLTPHYMEDEGYAIKSIRGWTPQGICACVGGPSVFYGGASFRFREKDFDTDSRIRADSDAQWPIGYQELERHYSRAERILGIAGEAGVDPTEPFRSEPYPKPPLPYASTGKLMADAADSLGLSPFRIPMAIDGDGCQSCLTCDAFACAVGAKNDLATRVIPDLVAKGMVLRPRTTVTRLSVRNGAIHKVHAADTVTGESFEFVGKRVILAAGALASPHIALASGLDQFNEGGYAVGRFLMRHCNGMLYGFFPHASKPSESHHKQVAIHDYYFGDPERPSLGKLGNVQQVMTPPAALVRALLPRAIGAAVGRAVGHLTGLLVIAEDQPLARNRVELRKNHRDQNGVPGVNIHHRYTGRDLAARRALLRRAKQVLKASGALFTVTWRVKTFSHAVGTMRMGVDPKTSVVDAEGRFRGLENLWVTDGSVFPTSAGVNPSLTIAANALRVGEQLAAVA